MANVTALDHMAWQQYAPAIDGRRTFTLCPQLVEFIPTYCARPQVRTRTG
ncbi:MAG: hypothetical protein ACK2UO_22865 [Caldilineaceae bacterium]|jgi:hypothetical protein